MICPFLSESKAIFNRLPKSEVIASNIYTSLEKWIEHPKEIIKLRAFNDNFNQKRATIFLQEAGHFKNYRNERDIRNKVG